MSIIGQYVENPIKVSTEKQIIEKERENMDRRILRTRQSILQAYKTLLQEKRVSITVQKICELANIGRSTFYIHFADKEELPMDMCRELFVHIGSETPEEFPVGEVWPSLDDYWVDESKKREQWRIFRLSVHIMKHMDRERNIYSRIFDESSDGWLYTAFRCGAEYFFCNYMLDELIKVPEGFPRKLYLDYLIDVLLMVIRWGWNNRNTASVWELGYYYAYFLTHGI